MFQMIDQTHAEPADRKMLLYKVGMFVVAGYHRSVVPVMESIVYVRWRLMVAISFALT